MGDQEKIEEANLPELDEDKLTAEELRRFAVRCTNRNRGEFGKGVLYAIEKIKGVDLDVTASGNLDVTATHYEELLAVHNRLITVLAEYEDKKMRKAEFIARINEALEPRE